MSETCYIVTTAPSVYDYDTATTLLQGECSRHNQSVRLVCIQVENGPESLRYVASYQADRYRSGFYAAEVVDDPIRADELFHQWVTIA